MEKKAGKKTKNGGKKNLVKRLESKTRFGLIK